METDQVTEKKRSYLDEFLCHHAEQKVGFGKYRDMKYKDVPESYFIFLYENHKCNGTNKHALEYGRLLKQKRKENNVTQIKDVG